MGCGGHSILPRVEQFCRRQNVAIPQVKHNHQPHAVGVHLDGIENKCYSDYQIPTCSFYIYSLYKCIFHFHLHLFCKRTYMNLVDNIYFRYKQFQDYMNMEWILHNLLVVITKELKSIIFLNESFY